MTNQKRFWILVIIVSISGFSQGMLLPLIAAIFENDGVSSSLNGLNATALYIGTLIISPFMEVLLRKFGYRPLIIYGGLLVFLALFMFPLWKSITFWFILRLLIGMGDHALHFSTQTWITSFSPSHRLGKNIALYGLSFGIGFAVGPQFVPLIQVFEGLPFIISGALCLFAWSFIFLLKNEFPEPMQSKAEHTSFLKRVKATTLLAWIAFLGPFGYGFLESSLNAMYPVFALRQGSHLVFISQLLTAFALGGILFQLPLGMLSDRFGKNHIMFSAFAAGGLFFFIAAYLPIGSLLSLVAIFIAGMFVGSSFSLGIAFMSELVSKDLLPMGNLLCGIFFSLGSLSGPIISGSLMEIFPNLNFLFVLSTFLSIIALILLIQLLFGSQKRPVAD